MKAKTGLIFRALPDVIVSIQDGPMHDAQWDAMVVAGREQGRLRGRFATLVVINGPPPSSRQRMMLNDAIAGLTWTCAAVTDSSLTRLATTAMSWFQPGLKTFSTNDMERAMDHVGATISSRGDLRFALDELCSQAGVPSFFCRAVA